ncbi:heavy metal translocating P-type ATPase [Corallococcus macrosporus]|uniref:P-type Zn(2+) transporter n=1 Tax=Myxococcus fulvus (strain ATCC BAA-855 / HW-1) TaxID=483219 RepID=F8C785_MYXFH|nr:heavy metal translocating P-type ATPase [Corallococcus macrosporus]AEI61961.1 heavy metal translocating P-type ATPase [Corallococcus macrosporus]
MTLLALALMGLAAGGVLHVAHASDAARWAWAATTAVVLLPTLVSIIKGLLRRETGVDLIAVLAMVGALALGEYLAGAIISVMLTGGAALERFAVARARRELSALLKRAPRVAHRRVGADISDVDVAEVGLGDFLVIKPGEVVPADGILSSGSAVLDESALTGESKPVQLDAGTPVRSGGTNAGGPFELRVTASAAESTYAGIIRLVKAAEESKAPFIRLADRYALGFFGLTLALSGFAWFAGGSPSRALAVLVVATPCPLILAAPAALLAGVSRAAKHGIIVKGGGPLETLARAKVLLLDKTGTVTSARPQVVAVETFGPMSSDDVVRHAASVEQLSVHPFAPAILAEARSRSVEPSFPADVREQMGTGIEGTVDGRRVAVGQLAFAAPDTPRTPELRSIKMRTAVEGSSSVYVSINGSLAGVLLIQDPIRPEAPRALRSLRAAGVQRIHMVTGDHPDVAELVGDAVGVDRVFTERTPEEKVEVIKVVRAEGITAMVGDGINDAPALALADIGVAMGARGATAASEAADVVLTADRLEGLLLATRIAQHTRRIALESIFVGMGLSLVAMLFAAAGYITPVAGAILQEGIDVLVILNALRALGGGGLITPKRPEVKGLAQRLASAHRSLRPHVSELAALAARLDSLEPSDARAQLERLHEMLETKLWPHEREEQQTAYPLLGKMLKDEDPTGPLIQTHHEIHRLARLFGRLVSQLPPEGPRAEDLRDLRRALYGLHAILTLHFAQEEELYSLFEA